MNLPLFVALLVFLVVGIVLGVAWSRWVAQVWGRKHD